MVLHLLHHKSYHPYKADNVARVQRDEAKARAQEEELDRRTTLADSEARVERLRKKVKKKEREREGAGEGEKELDRQLSGVVASEERELPSEESGTRIIRSEQAREGKGKEREHAPDGRGGGGLVDQSGHINFWSEFESWGKNVGINPEVALEKALQKEKDESLTKVYLAKRGEGDPKGWYATHDGKSERECKEGVEGSLERAYKDGEQKRLSDPLALMKSFLKRREEVLSGAPARRPSATTGRERYPVGASPSHSERGDLSPVITSLLAPRRHRGDPIPPPAPPSSTSTSSKSTERLTPQQESLLRVNAERNRTAALIASKKRAMGTPNSLGSETPSSERTGGGGFGWFNKEETWEAKKARREGGRGMGTGRGGGWEEKRRRREERERPY